MLRKSLLLFLVFLFIVSSLPVSAEGEVNLVEGLSYTIETGEPVTMSQANFSEGGMEFDVDNGQLTDGKTATNDVSSNGWYRAFRSQSRIVRFDLGSVSAISRIEAGFLHSKAPAIYAPRYINVYLSDDGDSFGTAIEYETKYPLSSDVTERCDFVIELNDVYSARYVNIVYSCDIFSYCDEIRVIGSKTLSGNEKKVKPVDETNDSGYFKSLDGVTDVIKLYNGYYKPDDTKGILNEEDLLPYIAYLDTNNNISGVMFDSVAFVPCHGDYPSGGRLVKTNGKSGAVMSDWELYFDYTFRDGQDLNALDSVVGRVYSELGLKDKYPVFLTIPYPTVIDKPFGDIDGDGLDEYCKTLEERVAIVKWFVDKYIKAFKDSGFENIELAGFYWLREEINYSDSDHEDLLAIEVNKYIKQKKLDIIFDAFYLSIGFDHWADLGFSGAVMQPNVAFSDVYTYFELGMLEEFAKSVYDNNLGVEMETNEPSYFRGDDYLKAGYNYESYLYYGKKTGYMNSFKTYYQGAGPGSFYDFCYADITTPRGIYLRRLYDLTYAFIHGTYKNEAPIVSVSDIELVSGDSRAMADISITDSDSYWGDITVEFVEEPKNGIVTVAGSKKTLVYRADDGFVGNDSFVIRVSDGFNVSEELTVNVSVSAPYIDESTPNESSDNSIDDTQNQEAVPLWLIIILGVMVAAMVGVAITMALKRKHSKS